MRGAQGYNSSAVSCLGWEHGSPREKDKTREVSVQLGLMCGDLIEPDPNLISPKSALSALARDGVDISVYCLAPSSIEER